MLSILSCIRSLLSAAYQLWLSPELADYPGQGEYHHQPYSHDLVWINPELAAAYHQQVTPASLIAGVHSLPTLEGLSLPNR